MSLDTITHTTLQELAEAGAIRQASAVALGDRWSIIVNYGGVQKTLAARNSGQVRSWASLNSLVSYLSGMGIRRFDTDATQYDPKQKSISRPDKSKTLKQAHEAAAHQKWFKEQVQKSIDDKRPALTHDEFKNKMQSWLTKNYGARP